MYNEKYTLIYLFLFLGSYIYVEATYGSSGDTTHLYSPVFKMNSTQCLHIHYHMWGEHVGMMYIYLNVS